MHLLTPDLAAAAEGSHVGPAVAVDGASIDSRTLRRGQLFVPVVAERDGHDFVPDALDAGAGAYLTSRQPQGGTAIVVGDTVEALARCGALARERLPDRVLAVTGSVGKSSLKDLLTSVLRQCWEVASSPHSFNNELGVPLTLLEAPDGADATVVEMGARGIGHIRELCSIARPTVGIVTAVAPAHTEMLGDVENVGRAKGELVEVLPASGTAVLNAGDERVRGMAARTEASVLLYGVETGDVAATGVRLDGELRPSFLLRTPWGEAPIRLLARGLHQAANAAGAAAAALAAGAPLDVVAPGLAQAQLSPLRMELHRTPSGALVLNDSYNANGTSTVAALESLAALEADRRTAVLGTMAELGDLAEAEHERVAEVAARLGIRLVAVGEARYGVEPVADIDEAVEALGPVTRGDAVLVKGSRVAGLERLAQRLLAG